MLLHDLTANGSGDLFADITFSSTFLFKMCIRHDCLPDM